MLRTPGAAIGAVNFARLTALSSYKKTGGITMPRKKNTRAAQGTGSIRKKTVLRDGREYSYWEARVTVGVDPGTGKQIRRSFSGKTQKETAPAAEAAG